jgi:hypothetical protein
MAVTQIHSTQFLLELLESLETETLKIALMVPSFSYDPDIHAAWADCSSNEIAGGYGYTAGGLALTGVSVGLDSETGLVVVSANTATWEAVGGPIADTASAIIYSDSRSPDKTVIKHIGFEETKTTTDGKLLQINLSNGFVWLDNIARS